MLRSYRLSMVLMLAGGLSVSATGCMSSLLNTEMLKPSNLKPSIMDGHGTEQRVVGLFTDAIAENNEAAFRRIVSTRFEQKAMRSPEAFKDLEILNLPKTKLEVVESKELAEKRLEAVAKEEKEGTKYQFIIVKDEVKNRWVVDDVMLRQQKKGTRATKSSVEVMDLLLTIREFLKIWESADRSAVLQAVNSELRGPLEKLPEPWLQQMIAQISAECESGMARRPEAQMNESDAVVKMPSKNGFMLLKVARQDEKWLVSDLEIRKRKSDDHPGSVLRQTRAMNAVTDFLAAYQEDNQERLQKLTEEKFFRNAISVGDLTMIKLPTPEYAPKDFEIQSFAGQLTVMIPDDDSVVRIDLTTPEVADAKDDRKRPVTAAVETEFIIENVTIYDRQTQQQRTLRSAFTAPARGALFLSALQSHDLPVLRQISTRDLVESVWSHIDPSLMDGLPLTGIPEGEMRLQNSNVRGEVTELEFQSANGQICSVLMRDENGELKVEDIQYPDPSAGVASLRTQLMLTVPVIELANAWENQDIQSIRRNSSLDFNRLVWSNLPAVPEEYKALPELLRMPVQRTQSTEQKARIDLASAGQPPVTVSLLKENTAWVIDEVSIKQPNGTQLELRKTLRQVIAQQFLNDPTGGIQQARFNGTTESDGGVVRAVGTGTTKRAGNLTLQSYGKPKNTQSAELPLEGLDLTEEELLPMPETSNQQTGTLHFGPASATKAKTSDASSALTPPLTRPKAATESEEYDGVVYFKGDATAKPKAAQETVTKPASSRRATITDPSQHPIEIPVE
ncbi:MAG: hypothetical protein U0936_08300 [Planctomycetaceae bacterium]